MRALSALLVLMVAASAATVVSSSFPTTVAASLGTAPCMVAFEPVRQRLVASTDMGAHTAQVLLSVPFDEFAAFVMQPAMVGRPGEQHQSHC